MRDVVGWISDLCIASHQTFKQPAVCLEAAAPLEGDKDTRQARWQPYLSAEAKEIRGLCNKDMLAICVFLRDWLSIATCAPLDSMNCSEGNASEDGQMLRLNAS